MNQIFAYLFLFGLMLVAALPVIGYIRNKYYYVDTTPIRYWLNKKNKIKKRYKSFRKRNKNYLRVNKINRFGSYNKYSKTKLTK